MRTEIFVSEPREITEVDTSTGELMRAYSRTTGASLPEARRVVLAMLTDAANTNHQGPRSKPEETPEVSATEKAQEDTYAPPRRDVNSFERKIGKGEDAAYHVLDHNEAANLLGKLLKKGRVEAVDLLDAGGIGLRPVKPYSSTRRGTSYRSSDVEDWATQYRKKKGQTDMDARQTGRRVVKPHFPAVVHASEAADIDSVAAGRLLFGDRARNRVFRQDTHFLSDEYFRSDLFRG